MSRLISQEGDYTEYEHPPPMTPPPVPTLPRGSYLAQLVADSKSPHVQQQPVKDLISLSTLHVQETTALPVLPTVSHAQIRALILENSAIAYRCLKKDWPISNSANTDTFNIAVARAGCSSFYAAVTYCVRGQTNAVRMFITGASAPTMEQTVAELSIATAEAVHAAREKQSLRKNHRKLNGGGTFEQ